MVHSGIVMVELPGMKIGCCLLPIVTWHINPSFLIKDGADLLGVDLISFTV